MRHPPVTYPQLRKAFTKGKKNVKTRNVTCRFVQGRPNNAGGARRLRQMSNMPTPFPPIGHHGSAPPYPALYLYPLNDSFVPKQISLAPGSGRVKVGRQTNAKTVPGERNGYFDSKVLSRQHAEVWEEGSKVSFCCGRGSTAVTGGCNAAASY